MTNSIGIIESKGFVALVEAADVILKNSPVEILGIKRLENGLVSLSVFGESEYVKSAVEAATNAGRRVGEIYAHSVIDDPNMELLNIISDLFELKGEEFQKSEKAKSRLDQTELKQNNDNGENISLIEPPEIKSKEIIIIHEQDHNIKKIVKHKPVINKQKEKEYASNLQLQENSVPEKSISTIERLRKEALGIPGKKQKINKIKSDTKKVENIIETSKSSIVDFEAIKEMNVHKLRNYARGFENFPIKGRQISRANRDELVDLFKTLN
jgi:microcompartment protein CcmL/EutN